MQDPSIYHPLSTDDIAPAFLNAEQQPPPDTPLSELLQNGHFRRAAVSAVSHLVQCAPSDAEHILQLLYTRLACLILISRPDLAAQEAVPLTDFLARNPPGAKDIVPLIPWELRLLLVRLQSIGAADGGRRGIMALYALAAEVRAHIKEALTDGEATKRETWSDSRLEDIGLRVADALVEMGELETANRHLDTLIGPDVDEIAYRRALLRIRVGDIGGAQRCVDDTQDGYRKAALSALLKVADGDFAVSTETWQQLMEEQPVDALSANNLAVSMLYTGHILDSRRVLEEMAGQLPGFPGLLFNLGTVYELCTERAIDHKAELAHMVSSKAPAPDSGGWEKATLDFKL